jgi:hypothetical protein
LLAYADGGRAFCGARRGALRLLLAALGSGIRPTPIDLRTKEYGIGVPILNFQLILRFSVFGTICYHSFEATRRLCCAAAEKVTDWMIIIIVLADDQSRLLKGHFE